MTGGIYAKFALVLCKGTCEGHRAIEIMLLRIFASMHQAQKIILSPYEHQVQRYDAACSSLTLPSKASQPVS